MIQRNIRFPQTLAVKTHGMLWKSILWIMVLCCTVNAQAQEPGQQAASSQGQQPIKIKGLVTDASGFPLTGATVAVKWTQLVTIADLDGNFELEVPYANATLEINYLGYQKEEYSLNGRTVVRIVLKDEDTALEEVVVVGYGTQKRESVIGSIATVSPGKLQANQSRAMSNALSGQIAGIIGVQRSGEPGYDSSDFWIRGMGTFNKELSKPLVIIDGIERSLDNLSPEEIESFSVLKDATATAIYGVKGANGAIVIKTKRGVVGKTQITVKADYGISAPVKLPRYVDGAKHMEVVNAARTLSGSTGDLYSPETIERTRTGFDPDLYPNVDWMDTVTEDYATNNRVSMDINGGAERLRFRFILGTFNEEGIIKTDDNLSWDTKLKLSKYNVRSNIDMDLTSSTLLSLSVGGYLMNRNAPGTSAPTILDWVMQTPPIVHPAMYSTGEYAQNVNRANPWTQATRSGYVKSYQNSIQSVATVEQNIGELWHPLRGLTAKLVFSFDAYNWHDMERKGGPDTYIATGRDADGKLQLSQVSKGSEFLDFSKKTGGNRNMYVEIPISYTRVIDKVHHLSGLLLYNQKDYVKLDAKNVEESFPYRSQGIAGRFAYDFSNKYFGEFNFGYNGSENFKKGYRYGFFPSFALGWLASNEAFLEQVNWLDKFKLRASWGKVGNDQISDGRRFAYQTTIDSGDKYTWGWNNQLEYEGIKEGDFGVPNLTWEESTKTNLGIELGVWRSLNIQLDFFQEKRKNIFMQRKTVPEIAGFNKNPFANYGKVENKGFDLSVEYNKQLTKDFSLSAMANLTHVKNKITEYDEALGIIGTNRAKTSWDINQNFGLIADGLYTEDDFLNPEKGILKNHLPKPGYGIVKPGDIKYVDVNGDNQIDALDICPIGNPNVPETVYGFGLSMKYKNFDMGFFFQGITNVDFIISGAEMIPGSGDGAIGNILDNVDDRWTPENPRQDVFYPRLSRTKSENNNQASTWWLKDGSFLRLKNFEVGYTLLQKQGASLPFRHARLFLRGSNLLTFSAFKLWDPELAGTGYKSYPSSKILSVGFDVTF